MIDLHSYEIYKLDEVADFERAKKGHVYPRGSSTIQVSATRGQIGYLSVPSEVDSKNVVVIPIAGINTKYFNIVLQRGIEAYMNKYATGINIQEKEIGNFEIYLHNNETQLKVVQFVNIMDEQFETTSNEIETLKELKSKLLSEMMI
ncbi:restriction endonuclease subunit S [Liquorilactobacillus mali]|uniref:restriction endonuclease subunit S n=1 Tax=Liquorilactobacillus mali TaxID=1618 RepID=UPI0023507086|nr:restriction endonuclease subunit S [Liquorilactobacillus mali]MDC7953204.1 restriction endonuclease subunit S [Liquorilactobacillus mali]